MGVIFAIDPSLFSFDTSVPLQDIFILLFIIVVVTCVTLYARITVGKRTGEDSTYFLFFNFGATIIFPFAAVFGKVALSYLVFGVVASIFWVVFVLAAWKPFRDILSPRASDEK
jgi:4-hydroxybenzoate polyprenyltransferase